MAPDQIARVVLLRLAAELADERATLDRLAAAIASLLAPASDERGEWMRALALAFEIERYCTAVESMLARVLKNVDESVPEGPGSHQEILRAASVPVDGLRPAVIAPASAAELRERRPRPRQPGARLGGVRHVASQSLTCSTAVTQ